MSEKRIKKILDIISGINENKEKYKNPALIIAGLETLIKNI